MRVEDLGHARPLGPALASPLPLRDQVFPRGRDRADPLKPCGQVRTEEVPWARPGARHSRDFQDVVAWLAQRTDKTTITRLLRMS